MSDASMLTIKRFYAWILAALLMLPAGTVAEQSDQIKITAIFDEPTTAAGFAILKQAYQRLGVDASILITPSRRALMMAETGLVDGDLFRIRRVAQLYPNLIRVEHPLLHGTLKAVVRKNEEHFLALPPEPSRAVAVRRGIIISELTAQNMGMIPVYANSNAQALSLLESKRVDVALFTFVAQFSPLKQKDLANIHIIEEPLAAYDLYHYLNRRHWKLANALPEVLRQLEEEGIKEEILEDFRERQGEWGTQQ
ncbi:MAG: amino acid ABC transporter substrate-binding protein [Gammaproteobacteria bacterium]|nr:amino acid ABC transporter substrate-binding protein [Gammaproteobacteria bacterium]